MARNGMRSELPRITRKRGEREAASAHSTKTRPDHGLADDSRSELDPEIDLQASHQTSVPRTTVSAMSPGEQATGQARERGGQSS